MCCNSDSLELVEIEMDILKCKYTWLRGLEKVLASFCGESVSGEDWSYSTKSEIKMIYIIAISTIIYDYWWLVGSVCYVWLPAISSVIIILDFTIILLSKKRRLFNIISRSLSYWCSLVVDFELIYMCLQRIVRVI